MSFTIKNLRQVEDMAPRFGFNEVQEARFPGKDLESESTGLAFHRVKPGCCQAFAHRHEQAEEIYVVLSGRGRIKLDDEVHDVRRWDILRIGPDVMRNLEAGPEGVTLIAFGAPLGEETDGNLVPGWWSD